MKKISFLSLICFLFLTTLFAQIPSGYYDNAAGKTGTALQSALHNIIKGHNSVSYNSLYTYMATTDARPDHSVWDMYSDIPGGTPPYVYHYGSNECGNYNSEADCFNREHSWPKSWFGGEVMPMYSDLFHLYPTDGYVNNRRDNYPYGEVGSASWTSLNGCKLGSSSTTGYSGTVFEPIDAYKGDFARTYFYMSTRYYTEDAGWPGSPMTTGAQLKPWALTMMLQWSNQDPVSTKETDRNNGVYNVQNNRNPFIDHPEYADLIWGDPSGISDQLSYTLTVYPNPVSDKCTFDLPEENSGKDPGIILFSVTGIPAPVTLTRNESHVTMDLTRLAPGLYILKATGSIPYHGMIIKN